MLGKEFKIMIITVLTGLEKEWMNFMRTSMDRKYKKEPARDGEYSNIYIYI